MRLSVASKILRALGQDGRGLTKLQKYTISGRIARGLPLQVDASPLETLYYEAKRAYKDGLFIRGQEELRKLDLST